MIKYYRKKRTITPTHKSLFSKGNYRFWDDEPNGIFELFETEAELNKFIQNNDFEEVMDDSEIDVKLPKDKQEEIPSLWKPVSELPINEVDVLIRLKNDSEVISGMFCWDKFVASGNNRAISINDIEEYCELTDFINDYEIIRKKVLEGK